MKKKSPISHEEEFRKWLPKNGVKSDSNYMAYIRQAKGVTGDSVDEFFKKIVDDAIKRKLVLSKFAANKKEKDVGDSVSALRKYWEFVLAKAEIVLPEENK